MWFSVLKQPQLSMGDVGLVDLSNVPEEEGRCKPKFLKMFNRLVDFFDTTAMDKKEVRLQSTFPVNPSSIGWNFKRKEKYTYPLKQVWLAYNDELPDIKYCEILEGAKRNKWDEYERKGYVYEYLVIDTEVDMNKRPFNLRLRWAENGDKDYSRQIKEHIGRLLKME